MAINFEKRVGLRKVLLVSGTIILAFSFLLFLGCLIGFLNFETFSLFGNSGLRNLASIAITGCLLAAIGSWND
jgi:hypothetical protein